ncbi:MAG: C-terminal helicase domain-containing protein, partial [Dehalococcoidia bacterium]|nr:C-terminal helicase domain-containing protein [Dehalococcoidia bacterium]
KAGGTGLNLTAASHVFHFDRWRNPAVEAQATDRAFRIGQKKNVQVHMSCWLSVERWSWRDNVARRSFMGGDVQAAIGCSSPGFFPLQMAAV